MNIRIMLLSFVISSALNLGFAQSPDSTKKALTLAGSALVTHNGINLVPTFSLNKPAAMFKFSAGKNRLSLDPEFNFSLEGKPWYFIFWLRYKLIQTERFRLNTAGQYGLNFREMPILINGSMRDGIMTERYVAGEVAPSYQLTRNLTVGIYYLHSHGLDPGTTNALDFLTLNASLSNINIADFVQFRITPQFYYLRQDDRNGVYFTSTFAVERKGFPLSLSSIINQPLETNIIGGDKFVWNVGVVYSFEKQL
ncbi:MAG: hypothetical protein KIT62_04455 [Cyclobacteriaceae bacterium]|nr:hypothetical protein [Cyclobacteriaceae bacterium]